MVSRKYNKPLTHASPRYPLFWTQELQSGWANCSRCFEKIHAPCIITQFETKRGTVRLCIGCTVAVLDESLQRATSLKKYGIKGDLFVDDL